MLKKKCMAQKIVYAVFLLFVMDLTKRSSGFTMINCSLSLYKIKNYGLLHVESNAVHIPLLTKLRNFVFFIS